MQQTAVLDRPGADPAGPEQFAEDGAARLPGTVRLDLVRTKRERPRLLVAVDTSPASTRQLVWALQEAARREATVLAVAVVDDGADADQRAATRTLLEAQLLHAVGQTGVHGRARTALLDQIGYEALAGTASGADLVLVRTHSKTVLRPAVPRPPARRRSPASPERLVPPPYPPRWRRP